MDSNSSLETSRDTIPDTMFESFFDSDSSTWSLRKVSTIPPCDEAEAA